MYMDHIALENVQTGEAFGAGYHTDEEEERRPREGEATRGTRETRRTEERED